MIFGIDFGTTHIVVAWDDKKISLLPWDNGKFLLPSIIEYGKKTKFGKEGVASIKNIKRMLAENSFNVNKKTKVGKTILEITEDFFAHIEKRISEHLGLFEQKKCIVTVPARFDDNARNAIKAAAIKAGFEVIRIIAEPTAAAISCINPKHEGNYLVYDLGGGTFDATLLKFSENVFQVLATDGIANFGGIDLDKAISDHYKIEIEEAKTVREALSFEQNINFKNIPYKRNELDQIISPLLKKTYQIIEKMIAANDLEKKDIDNLILAGGATRTPLIKHDLAKDYLIADSTDPEYIVACGAAIHATMLCKQDQMLIDVTPFSLGIEVFGDAVEIIIPRNSPIPISKTQYFTSAGSNKTLINILQGESNKASECVSLGKLEIDSRQKVKVNFMLDSDGILSIKVGEDNPEVVVLKKI